MQIEFAIPNFFHVSTQSYLIAGLIFIASLLSILVTNIYKKHYINKKDVKLAKHWASLWVTGSATFFTYLGWLVAFASANVSFLQGIPYVGDHILQVLGLTFAIYNIRLKPIYKGIVSGLSKFSKSDDTVVSPIGDGVTTTLQAPTDEQTFDINPTR